jgi:pimeloyl-ACP methyl ester carboxylesterase
MPSRLTPRLDTAISTDGTRIAFWRSGSGLPLLLVHGATADHTTTWRIVLPALEERFAVSAMDRRGRGDSGDSASYVFDPGRFASMATPTMLLVGGASPPRELANARAVASVLPNGIVTVLDGQQHIAMHTAPELFVQEVERFLTR